MNTRKEPATATTPESFVDALNSAFGKQTTQRAAHAKGVVLLGKFVPAAEAASVSKALHFKHRCRSRCASRPTRAFPRSPMRIRGPPRVA